MHLNLEFFTIFFPYKIIVILKKQGFAKYMHHLKYPDELTITHNMELHADFFFKYYCKFRYSYALK